ncbi:hypothetical protein E0504_35095 [Parafrankia sp. BMG5.11]|nr:hypothetical protein E0504_35095 [Parafrankia sp. BMG5.11]
MHHTGPDAERVPELMDELCGWLQGGSPGRFGLIGTGIGARNARRAYRASSARWRSSSARTNVRAIALGIYGVAFGWMGPREVRRGDPFRLAGRSRPDGRK